MHICFFAHSSAELRQPTRECDLPEDVRSVVEPAVSAEEARQNMVGYSVLYHFWGTIALRYQPLCQLLHVSCSLTWRAQCLALAALGSLLSLHF